MAYELIERKWAGDGKEDHAVDGKVRFGLCRPECLSIIK